MNDNVKLDIAIEIMSSKVAEAMDRVLFAIYNILCYN